MAESAADLNFILESLCPALHRALSPLGRAAFFPLDIPAQSEQARRAAYNATIGQITDGAGRALKLPSIELLLQGLPPDQIDRAVLYSPVAGLPDLRGLWRRRQRRLTSSRGPSSLPIVTVGLTHGLALMADLFAGEGTPVAIPTPFWGNYRQTFAFRRGARVVGAPAYLEGSFNCTAIEEALSDEPPGLGALAVLNLPSNPGGYAPTSQERARILESLQRVAEERTLVVVCDDAYAGLVHEEGIPKHSIFWDLIGRHQNLIPVKVDGGTKEFDFFGGRIGFLTFAYEAGSDEAEALEKKIMGLIRAGVGSPVSTTQSILAYALEDETIEQQIARVKRELTERYQTLRSRLSELDSDLCRTLPFNAGCFALIELVASQSEEVRQHLLRNFDTGVVSIAPNYVRLAYCSVSNRDIPELVRRFQQGVASFASV